MNELHEAINDARHEALAEYDAQRQAQPVAVGEHTVEPWGLAPLEGKRKRLAIVPGDWPNGGGIVAELNYGRDWLRPETEANARRIVACVNACAGIGTEALEAGELRRVVRDLVQTIDACGSVRESDLDWLRDWSGEG